VKIRVPLFGNELPRKPNRFNGRQNAESKEKREKRSGNDTACCKYEILITPRKKTDKEPKKYKKFRKTSKNRYALRKF